jgi:hypothetical protein
MSIVQICLSAMFRDSLHFIIANMRIPDLTPKIKFINILIKGTMFCFRGFNTLYPQTLQKLYGSLTQFCGILKQKLTLQNAV